MSKPKGSTTEEATAAPDTIKFTTEERVEFIASLIVERIIEDQTNGKKLVPESGGIADADA
jgi:hypothetical protein